MNFNSGAKKRYYFVPFTNGWATIFEKVAKSVSSKVAKKRLRFLS
jgi:hypothetical protein